MSSRCSASLKMLYRLHDCAFAAMRRHRRRMCNHEAARTTHRRRCPRHCTSYSLPLALTSTLDMVLARAPRDHGDQCGRRPSQVHYRPTSISLTFHSTSSPRSRASHPCANEPPSSPLAARALRSFTMTGSTPFRYAAPGPFSRTRPSTHSVIAVGTSTARTQPVRSLLVPCIRLLSIGLFGSRAR